MRFFCNHVSDFSLPWCELVVISSSHNCLRQLSLWPWNSSTDFLTHLSMKDSFISDLIPIWPNITIQRLAKGLVIYWYVVDFMDHDEGLVRLVSYSSEVNSHYFERTSIDENPHFPYEEQITLAFIGRFFFLNYNVTFANGKFKKIANYFILLFIHTLQMEYGLFSDFEIRQSTIFHLSNVYELWKIN